MKFTNKEKRLYEYIKDLTKEKVIVAYSGGVDSSLVLKIVSQVAKKENYVAMTFKSEFTIKEDINASKEGVEKLGVSHIIKEVVLKDMDQIKYNDVKRCYYCKKALFSEAVKYKKEMGFGYVLDGSNLDDSKVYRPGRKASKELGVVSPLEDVGFTKKEVRDFAKKLGLKTASRPSSPCLLTRFPYSKEVNFDLFEPIEKGEEYLKSLGFKNVRVRICDTSTVRIEVDKDSFKAIIVKREEIVDKFKGLGFNYICLDLEGYRSGSMDEITGEINEQRE